MYYVQLEYSIPVFGRQEPARVPSVCLSSDDATSNFLEVLRAAARLHLHHPRVEFRVQMTVIPLRFATFGASLEHQMLMRQVSSL